MTESPVVIAYEHNEPDVKRSEIDKRIYRVFAALGALCSSSNSELDSRDLYTWINYNKASIVEPQLSQLFITMSNEEAMEIPNPISMASLLEDPDTALPQNNPDYSTVGYRANDSDSIPDLHCIINKDGLVERHKYISGELARYQELAQSRASSRKSFVDASDEVTDGCLVL